VNQHNTQGASGEKPGGSPRHGKPASLRIGSLCSGLDGAIMTALDAHLAWYAENSSPHAGILAASWPGIPNLGDIAGADWAAVAPAGMITAGWPPMGISPPGRIAGLLHARSTGRWRGIERCLRELLPDYAYLSNVTALNPRGRARVQAGLARLGYGTQWAAMSTRDIGGPPAPDRAAVHPRQAARHRQPSGSCRPHEQPVTT